MNYRKPLFGRGVAWLNPDEKSVRLSLSCHIRHESARS